MGENVPIKVAVKRQIESKQEFYYYKTMFAKGLSQFKYDAMVANKPKVLVLGQSIVLNFRDFFFHPYEAQFYNTGLMALNAQDFKYVASLIREKKIEKPEFMVIGIDFSLFIKDIQVDKKRLAQNLDVDPVYDFNQHIKAIQDVYFKKDLRQKLPRYVGIGLRGAVGSGFRKDGSFSYMWEMENFLRDSTHVEGELKDNLVKRVGEFKSPMIFDENKKTILLEVLKEYKDMGIEILLYFPPLTNNFYDFGMKNNKEFSVLFSEFLEFQSYVKSIGYDIIPFNTTAQLNLNDYYMHNSNHPGDILVAKQFSAYCKSPDRKNKFIDKIKIDYLDSLIHSPKSNCLSFMRDTLVFK